MKGGLRITTDREIPGGTAPSPACKINLPYISVLDSIENNKKRQKNGKKNKIVPEVKILAVADVAEATASHRPYRSIGFCRQ